MPLRLWPCAWRATISLAFLFERHLIDRFEALRAALIALGDDVQETMLRFYIAFKRIKNFVCVEFRPTAAKILLFVKVDPADVQLDPASPEMSRMLAISAPAIWKSRSPSPMTLNARCR
jgi:hypothetical protein